MRGENQTKRKADLKFYICVPSIISLVKNFKQIINAIIFYSSDKPSWIGYVHLQNAIVHNHLQLCINVSHLKQFNLLKKKKSENWKTKIQCLITYMTLFYMQLHCLWWHDEEGWIFSRCNKIIQFPKDPLNLIITLSHFERFLYISIKIIRALVWCGFLWQKAKHSFLYSSFFG